MSALVGEMEKPPGRRRYRQTSSRSREDLQGLGYQARWRTAMREPASGGWLVKLPTKTRARKVGLAGWMARSDHLQMAKVELRGCVKRLAWGEAVEHEIDHGELDHRLAAVRQGLIVLTQAAVAA
jgi:hypothetical protein